MVRVIRYEYNEKIKCKSVNVISDADRVLLNFIPTENSQG